MSLASKTHLAGRKPEPKADPLRELAIYEHRDDVCNGRLPLAERLVAFEWLCDARALGGSIHDLESMLCKEVARAGGEVKGGPLVYRARPDGRLYRGWAP